MDKTTAEPKTPFGHTFVQREGEGYASYHFESLTDCFINYASVPKDWKLDDGTKFPTKKHFSNITYDAATRTMKCSIDWSPHTKRSEQRWQYEMVFNELCTRISGGQIQMFPPRAAEPTTVAHFGKQVEYRQMQEIEAVIVKEQQRRDKGAEGFSKETQKIVKIMDNVFSKHREATDSTKWDGKTILNLAFGQSMQMYARDVAADSRVKSY